jgi:pyruvate formate lyase activating enzyme
LIAPPDVTSRREFAGALRIGGFEPLSAVDWPGELAAVVFCQGCGWACRYCHNPHLIPHERPAQPVAWTDIVAWLGRRRGLLDGVVFSGGEPTLQSALTEAASTVRELGFRVGLHTGGPVPENLAPLLPLLDWVGFDFKAPFDRYAQVTGHDHGVRARESLRLLTVARVAVEVRTTWHPQLLSVADLTVMARSLIEAGVTTWTIQRFRPDGCADPALCALPVGEVPAGVVQFPGLRVSVR